MLLLQQLLDHVARDSGLQQLTCGLGAKSSSENSSYVLLKCVGISAYVVSGQGDAREELTNKLRVSGSSEKTPAAPDWALAIERLEELHCPHGALAVVPLAVQWRRYQTWLC